MKLKLFFAVAALAALASGTAALADPAPAASPSADRTERVQLARRLFDLSGGAKGVDQRIDAMFALSAKLIAANTPADGAKFAVAMQRDTAEEMHKLTPSLVDASVEAYADNLTTQELRDYVAWLDSDSGKSLLRKMPAIREEMSDRSLPLLSAMLPEMQQRISDRVCSELHCSASERKIVAVAMSKAFSPKKS